MTITLTWNVIILSFILFGFLLYSLSYILIEYVAKGEEILIIKIDQLLEKTKTQNVKENLQFHQMANKADELNMHLQTTENILKHYITTIEQASMRHQNSQHMIDEITRLNAIIVKKNKQIKRLKNDS
jgi:hypothetical protein